MKIERVKFFDNDLFQSYSCLPKNSPIRKSIVKAVIDIKNNCNCGRNVKKRLIPKCWKEKYKINNLWIYNLSGGWRLFYTIGSDGIEVVSIVLDWMSHKKYENVFGY